MFVESVYARSFRNLRQQEVLLSPGVNLLFGKTGQGKTSFLEVLSLLILGASFRTHFIRDAISFGSDSFFVEAKTNHSGVEGYVSVGYDGSKRHVLIDRKEVSSTKELLGSILGVSAALSDMELLVGPPALRRRYLDEQIAEIDPVFIDHLTRATRALQQRNALLKEGEFSQLGIWDEILAKSASYVTQARRKTALELIPFILMWFEKFPTLDTLRSGLEIRFKSQLPDSESESFEWLKKELFARRDKERAYKKTLVGHHRDDLEFSFRGISLRQSLSLGQLRMMVLSIRLAEWSLLAQRSKEKPLFLLDDVDGTLDKELQEHIFEILFDLGQVIVTSHTDWHKATQRLCVEDGVIRSMI